MSVPNLHGFSALDGLFQRGGAILPAPDRRSRCDSGELAGAPFRIDHDEKFNQTTHFQYQPWKRGPWLGFNWRYDSGLVAGNAPCYGVGPDNDCPQSTTIGGQPAVLLQDVFGNPLSADQEFQAGFTCNGVRATPTTPMPSSMPGIAVRIQSDPGAGDQCGERRPQSAAHRLAQPVRRLDRRRQPVQGRPLQMESHAHGHQHDQQDWRCTTFSRRSAARTM